MKPKTKNQKSKVRGQSLFEVVVALAITALIVAALVSLTSNAVRNSTYSKNNSQAANSAQELTEWLRGERDRDIAAFETNALTPVWCFPTLGWNLIGSCGTLDKIPGTPFVREATFTVDTQNGKTIVQADITVSWTDPQGFHEVKSSTNYADWRQR